MEKISTARRTAGQKLATKKATISQLDAPGEQEMVPKMDGRIGPSGGDDAIPGGGGVCVACPLGGGITTEEEMFASGGAY